MADKILTVDQLIKVLKGRKYKWSQIHHTYQPDHADFTGKNHLALQQGMRNYHMNNRGWYDIGQHVTLMPDGLFVTGRDFEDDKVDFDDIPAGIAGYNTGAFMVEMLGNFDKGHDKLEGKQLDAMVKLQKYLTTECGATVMFHREHAPKTCPGTGIDKEEFMKLVKACDQKEDPVKPISKPVAKPVDKPIPYPGHLLKNGVYNDKYVGMAQDKLGIKKDNDFGPKTEKYVRAWQKANGLVADGKIGPLTWAKMFS